jgi:hypothetical protein
MHCRMRRLALILTIACAGTSSLGLTGCSKPAATQSSATQGPSINDGLTDLRDMLKEAAGSNTPPPTSQEEMVAFDAVHPVAGAFIQSEQIIYVWGSALKPDGGSAQKVVGYEPTCTTTGGQVLLENGEIKQVSAAEFQQLQK